MRRIAILVGLLMLMAGNAGAGIVRNYYGTREDTLHIDFYLADSLGQPIAASNTTVADSFWLQVKYPDGGAADSDKAAFTSATTATCLNNAARLSCTVVRGNQYFYTYSAAVRDIDGTSQNGTYTYVLIVRDTFVLGGNKALMTIFKGEFQVYTSTTHTFAANQDSVGFFPIAKTINDSNLARLTTRLTYRDSVQTKAVRDSLQYLMTLKAVNDSNLARLVTRLTYRDSVQVKAVRDSLQFVMMLKTVNDSNLARLTTRLTYRDSVQAKAVRDSLQYVMMLKTVNDSNLARLVTHLTYRDSVQAKAVRDSVQYLMTLKAVTDSNLARLATRLTYRDSVQVKAIRDSIQYAAVASKAVRDSLQYLMTLKAVNDSNLARLITHLTYRDSVQAKAVRDSLQYLMTLKAITDSNLARLITHLTYRDSVQTKAIRDSLQYLGSAGSDPSTYWRDTLNQLLTAAKAMRDSGQYYAQTGSSGSGAQTLTITVLDTSGTDAVVVSANVTVQNIGQTSTLWTGATGTGGTVSGNNAVSTQIAIVAWLPGYTFPVFKDTTGSGSTFSDTVRGYNIDIGSPALSNLCRVSGYIYTSFGTVVTNALVRFCPDQSRVGSAGNLIVVPRCKSVPTSSTGAFQIDVIMSDSLHYPSADSTFLYNIEVAVPDGNQPGVYNWLKVKERITIPSTATYELYLYLLEPGP